MKKMARERERLSDLHYRLRNLVGKESGEEFKEMKRKYQAVFSNGTVAKRSTEHEYKTAWRTVDFGVTPRRVMGVGFSSSLNPSGVRYSSGSLSYMSANQRDRERKKERRRGGNGEKVYTVT